MSTQDDLHVRHAEPGDYDAVVDFTQHIWTDRGGDYLQYVYHDWIADDGDGQRTFVVDAGDGDIAGIVQAVMLSAHEAWFQGMRVNPDYQGQGITRMLNAASFDWAADHGATVGRNMVYSWNEAGLGAARAAGFEPGIEFRWAHPEPDIDALDRLDGTDRSSAPDRSGADPTITSDPDAAWAYWQRSDANALLHGLALDLDESWALSELTPDDLRRLTDETRVFAVQQDTDTTGMAYRVRDYERPDDEGTVRRYAEYGLACWDDIDSARALYAGIAEDAAELGADDVRVLIPETPRYVTDTAWARSGISDEPTFVLELDLTDRQ